MEPLIEPRNDYLVVRRIDPPEGLITLTDAEKGMFGEVLAVGPGKWVPGESTLIDGEWTWVRGHRRELEIKPGMIVCFNSKWNDFASDHASNLPIGFDKQLHLIQEGDIIGIRA